MRLGFIGGYQELVKSAESLRKHLVNPIECLEEALIATHTGTWFYFVSTLCSFCREVEWDGQSCRLLEQASPLRG